MSVDKISSGPACDPKSLFIEITGINHPAEHSIQFYDETNNTQQVALENKKQTETLTDTTIHSWKWVGQPETHNAWLAVESDSGHIKLPLYQELTACTRADGRQDYHLHAVMPLALMPTINQKLKDQERAAPVRNGYLYVFYNDLAWREIEIRHQGGAVEFKDIDLVLYRSGANKPFKHDAREPTGKPLTEIWLPAQDNNKATKVRVAYSEVQWSGARLNFLEANPDKMAERLVSLQSLKPSLATKLPELRAREPEIELQLANPLPFNRDLSGGYLTSLYQKLETEQQKLKKGGVAAGEAIKYVTDERFEYGARCHALREITKNEKKEGTFDDADSFIDYLEDAKARKLRTITLTDQLFELRHKTAQPTLAAGYLQLVQQNISQQKYVHSAEIVQRLVIPPKFGEEENPLHKYRDDLYGSTLGVFGRTLRSIERKQFRQDLVELQKGLEKVLNDNQTAIDLCDLTSLNDINGATGHTFVNNAFKALMLDGDKLDTLNPIENQTPHKPLQTLANILNVEGNHPLHLILFVPKDSVTLSGIYKAPEAANDGSGLATPENLQRWSDKKIYEIDKIENIDLEHLASLNKNEESSFGNFRRIAHWVGGVMDGFFEALMAIRAAAKAGSIVVDFRKIYTPSLSTFKHLMGKDLAEMVYQPTSGPAQKGYIIGVNGAGLVNGQTFGAKKLKHGTGNRNGAINYGSVYDDNGILKASTKKSAFPKGTKLTAISTEVVIMLSDDGELVKNKLAAQKAIENVGNTKFNVSNAYEKLRVPHIISIIEVFNLMATVEGLKYEKNIFKKGMGQMSAILDLSLALIISANMMSERAATVIKAKNISSITFKPGTVARFTYNVGKTQLKLVGSVSRLALVGFVAGILTAGIALWDSYRLFSAQDNDAGFGMLMLATGTAITAFASAFIASSSAFLGLGPIGWFGIGLALAGGLIVYYFTDSPIEAWLKNGPFGKSPDIDDSYAPLQDPQTAFSQFINIIMSLTVSVYPLAKIQMKTQLSAQERTSLEQQGVTHGIWVRSNLMQLLGVDNVELRLHARQCILQKITEVNRTGPSYSKKLINKNKADNQIISVSESNEGRIYYMAFNKKIPKKSSDYSFFSNKTTIIEHVPYFMVRAQVVINGQVFPTLPIKQLDEKTMPTALPAFSEHDLYWADELNYAIRQK